MQRPWIWIAALVLAGLLFAAPAVVNRVKRGARVTDAEAPDGGYTTAEPKTLATKAGVSLEIYTAGRVLASEAASGSEAERIATLWCVVNEARARKQTIYKLATGGTKGAGFFGAQNAGGRYVSTRRDPTTADIALATRILGGELTDPTGGARRFISPAGQDALAARGQKGYTKTAEDIFAKWGAEGWQRRTVAGVDPYHFVVFVKVGGLVA